MKCYHYYFSSGFLINSHFCIHKSLCRHTYLVSMFADVQNVQFSLSLKSGFKAIAIVNRYNIQGNSWRFSCSRRQTPSVPYTVPENRVPSYVTSQTHVSEVCDTSYFKNQFSSLYIPHSLSLNRNTLKKQMINYADCFFLIQQLIDRELHSAKF